ncbi:hypothetical protein DTO164E3_4742 [Paecilomyces variotii]|nr:hypothetical protein DTO032I3_7526 [Paecilomyces variotii]KAJ9199430.1 hypothetical protein DTO164E3_4742 [Paecilomyces variotii]KAJ9278377.1 hypothetical protein DTO021D3_4856 [Paecilomyces variotii]KAJ9325344.1 hypothetical protein DTO027B3_3539 [Paecilomyces variotii]KAJ9330871.1 hypothetical protein DTO027B5_7391 [Paecilomyces variotii]
MDRGEQSSLHKLLQTLQQKQELANTAGYLKQLSVLANILKQDHPRECSALSDVIAICSQPPELGGLGLTKSVTTNGDQESEILFLVSAWLEALNSADRAKSPPVPLSLRPPGRRGMTLSEKIFAFHDIDRKGSVAPGELIRVDVDWVIASEASWSGMERTYNMLGKPGIFRNDRFWLAGDHVVDPRVNKTPKVQALIDASERARRVFKMTDYQGMNYTILHTEFYRERAQPGMVVIGSDSHTCSSGALGCLAIGLGAADVTLPLVTGETWFKVPESVNIRLTGAPKPGIGGKDTILYILQQLKRNTVAADRIVEFSGPGAKHLSCDARFAICNMTTEFGGITGVFVPDEITEDFIQRRHLLRHKNAGVYFQPDEDAVYAETHTIDLGNVRSFIAKYPNPDDVVPVTDEEGMDLDGCFIGACTTAEEDLILGALVLEQGLKNGLKPIPRGKRKVVPGSMPILHRLQELGLATFYEDAGFEIGIPGCSYCVGMSADQAGPGEVWLSSQNRNFENRMGKGSIGNLSSAATVAASSFEMKVRDPHELLAAIDLERWNRLRGISSCKALPSVSKGPTYVEPSGAPTNPRGSNVQTPGLCHSKSRSGHDKPSDGNIMRGKVQLLGDFIDTDALAPAMFLMNMKTNEISGSHCLQLTHPEFRQRVKAGFNIIVAGKAFGCGSSREQAVMALLGCGVQCVIAKSFAFIFQRNMPNLGLLGITMTDDAFYESAADGAEISIDFTARLIEVDGKRFGFELSRMERELFKYGGIASAFRKFGNSLFEKMTGPKNLGGANEISVENEGAHPHAGLQW